jgi:hypothetical protein
MFLSGSTTQRHGRFAKAESRLATEDLTGLAPSIPTSLVEIHIRKFGQQTPTNRTMRKPLM